MFGVHYALTKLQFSANGQAQYVSEACLTARLVAPSSTVLYISSCHDVVSQMTETQPKFTLSLDASGFRDTLAVSAGYANRSADQVSCSAVLLWQWLCRA